MDGLEAIKFMPPDVADLLLKESDIVRAYVIASLAMMLDYWEAERLDMDPVSREIVLRPILHQLLMAGRTIAQQRATLEMLLP